MVSHPDDLAKALRGLVLRTRPTFPKTPGTGVERLDPHLHPAAHCLVAAHRTDPSKDAAEDAELEAMIDRGDLMGFLRGAVMKASQGKADPKIVGQLLEKKLAQ